MKESRNPYDLPGVAADEEAEQAFLGRPGDMKSKLGEIWEMLL